MTYKELIEKQISVKMHRNLLLQEEIRLLDAEVELAQLTLEQLTVEIPHKPSPEEIAELFTEETEP